MPVRWRIASAAALVVVSTAIGVAQAQAATGSLTSSQNLSANPILATSTTGWRIAAGGTSLRRVSVADHVVATNAAQVTSTATTTRLREPRVAVVAGSTFSFASDVKATNEGARASVSVSWFAADGGFLNYNEGSFVPVNNSVWTRAFVSAVAPPRAAFARSQVNVINTAANASILVTQHEARVARSVIPATNPPTSPSTSPSTSPPTSPLTSPPTSPSSSVSSSPPPSLSPSAPAASATQVFNGDLESGNLSQFQTCQTRFYNGPCRGISPSYSLGIETDTRGKPAARLEVRDGDQPFCCGERAQMVAYNTRETEGKDYWYDWSFMIDQQYPISNSWQTLLQWHSEVDGSPPLAFYTEGTNLVLQTRPRPNAPYTGVTDVWTTPFVKGQWMDLKLHVGWSSNANVGFVQVWKNGVSQTFSATPPENGNGSSCVGQSTCKFRNIYPGDAGNRAMISYYRDPAISGTGVVHVDNFDVATGESALSP